MNECTLRSNLQFLAAALSAISAMSLFFFLLSWAVGGTPYFQDALAGQTVMPILLALIAGGAVVAIILGKKERTYTEATSMQK